MSKPPSRSSLDRSFERLFQSLQHSRAELQDDVCDDETERDTQVHHATPAELAQMYQLYKQHQDFIAGDIVEWKPGLKNRRLPQTGHVAIVMDVLDAPVFDTSEHGMSPGVPTFREPHDIKLGLMHDGEFLVYHYDSNRFQRARTPTP